MKDQRQSHDQDHRVGEQDHDQAIEDEKSRARQHFSQKGT